MRSRAHSERAGRESGAESVAGVEKGTIVGGLPPKFWRRAGMLHSGFPFARNRSLSLQRVLDDAFARIYHNPLEDLIDGLLGLFSLGPRAAGRSLEEKQLSMVGSRPAGRAAIRG